jgi:hypothetical protein
MKLDLAAIRARADAATPGPWRAVDTRVSVDLHDHVVAGSYTEIQPSRDGALVDEHYDCDFIATARTDVPALVARVVALEAALREILRVSSTSPAVADALDGIRDGARAALEGES